MKTRRSVRIETYRTGGIVRLLLIIAGFVLAGCNPEYSPKPKGYNKIELPQPGYISLIDTLPYGFDYSRHARITSDSSWIAEKYWIDLTYPALGATIQVTYKSVKRDQKLLREYLKDSYDLTSKHNVKAYAIEEAVLNLNNGFAATIMELSGEVPSQFQFHVTDSVDHFLRGALYFKTATQNDSLAPVIDYVKNDILFMLNSLRWND